MPVEWAWLRPQPRVELADRGLFLEADGGCMALLLHGLTGSPAELGYIAYHLRHRGRVTVHCPRLVDHGQPIDILARVTAGELYASARSAFLEARATAGERNLPLVVGGLSLGASMALMLAAEFPDDVAGVVCLSPTLFYDGWNVPWTQRLLPLADWTPIKYFAYFRESAPFGLRDEALRAKIADQYRRMSLRDSAQAATLGYAHFPVRLFCEMRRVIARCKRALPSVRCPVLVVQAANDDMTSPKNARFILDRISSERRELMLLEQSYHLVTADLERAAVAERLQQFCESVSRPAASVRADEPAVA